MKVSESRAAIDRNIEGAANIICEAWTALRILEGIHRAAQAETIHDEVAERCASNVYRTAFTALYVHIGAAIDADDDTHGVSRLIKRLKAEWADDASLLEVAYEVEQELAILPSVRKLKAWRHKAIAHATNRKFDVSFYEANKVTLDEVSALLEALESCFNKLTVNATSTVYCLASATPSLDTDIENLLGRPSGNT